MSSKISPKLLLTGLLVGFILIFGSMYAVAQYGPSTSMTYSDEVTLQGTIDSVDEDHGFTMMVDSVTYYIGVPYTVDKAELGITVGSEVTVTGYIVDSPMMSSSDYTMVHATSINGIVIDHDMQAQDRDGNCGGSGGMGNHYGGMRR